MSEHYYSSKPQTESNPRHWKFTLLGHTFSFETDAGVFSKSEVDFGSRVLIDTFKLPDIQGALLDVGCGYGPIGLSLAKAYPERTVYMMDINERAVALSCKNAEANGVQNVRIFESDGHSSRVQGMQGTIRGCRAVEGVWHYRRRCRVTIQCKWRCQTPSTARQEESPCHRCSS